MNVYVCSLDCLDLSSFEAVEAIEFGVFWEFQIVCDRGYGWCRQNLKVISVRFSVATGEEIVHALLHVRHRELPGVELVLPWREFLDRVELAAIGTVMQQYFLRSGALYVDFKRDR